MSIFREPIPREVPMLDAGNRFPSKRWLAFFEQFVNPRATESSGNLADIPTAYHATTNPRGLRQNDAGYIYEATDYKRRFRWTGTAWEYAPGERLTREIIWYPGTLPSGWALCDGSSVTVTAANATTGSFTTPDLTGQFVKGGTYDGSVVGASTPAITGATASDGNHTHNVSASGTAAATANVAGSNVAAGAFSLDVTAHTHAVSVTGATDSQGAHAHGAGTLALSGSAEPAHVLLLPIVKL